MAKKFQPEHSWFQLGDPSQPWLHAICWQTDSGWPGNDIVWLRDRQEGSQIQTPVGWENLCTIWRLKGTLNFCSCHVAELQAEPGELYLVVSRYSKMLGPERACWRADQAEQRYSALQDSQSATGGGKVGGSDLEHPWRQLVPGEV